MQSTQTGVADYPYSQEMPSQKRQRRGSKRYAKTGGAVVRVPRAISTRGTPDGYYEMPMRQLFRVYGNTSSGLWNTNQTTSAPLGVTGYKGMSLFFALDNTYLNLGTGGASATIVQSVPDIASFTNIFDLCKIVDCEVEVWFTNHSRDLGTGIDAYGAPELFLCEDNNDGVPPNSFASVLDRKRVLRCSAMADKRFKMKVKPYMVLDASTNDGSGSTTSLGVAQPSTYCRLDRPAVNHFGFKGWDAIPEAATSYTYVVNILVTQTRRYKMNN